MIGYGVSQQYYDEQVARNAALKEKVERLRRELAAAAEIGSVVK